MLLHKKSPKSKSQPKKQHIEYHKDGTLWAKGPMAGDVPVGYWEWFRKDGVRMRSGHFDNNGKQTGEWTTYDKTGAIYKITHFKPKAK